jgi:hypothetical protein
MQSSTAQQRCAGISPLAISGLRQKQKSSDSVEPAAQLSCRINIGGPLAPRMRAGASPISSPRLATHYRLSLRPSEDATQHNAFNLISRSVSLEKRSRGASTGAHSTQLGELK